jgi:DNA topoisomerase-1
VLQAFWANFQPQLHAAGQVVLARQRERQQAQSIGESCPQCGGELVQRQGSHGAFIGCTNFPKCAYTRGFEHRPVRLQPAAGA